jgi:type I restriction enzyme S subunit
MMAIDKSKWERVKFGDVVRLNTERCADPAAAGIERYVGLEHIDPDDLRIRRWGLVAEGTTFTNRFRPGQVLFGKRRAYQRKVAVADFEGVCSSDIYVFEPHDGRLLRELLAFICQGQAFYSHAVGTSAGSLSPRTHWSHLANFEFLLPSKEEQIRIVGVLTSLDDNVSLCRQLQNTLNTLLVSRSENLIQTYCGTDFYYSVDSLLLENPQNGYSPPTSDTVSRFKTVSISAVNGGKFQPSGNTKYANVLQEQVHRFLVQKNDIFVVRGNGNKSLTGKCGIAGETYNDLFYPDLLIRLRFNPAKILPEFAAIIWNSPSVHNNLVSRAKSTNGIWKINGQDIRVHRFVVPQLHIQRQFVTENASILVSAISINSRIAGLQTIKSRIACAIFEGDV